jgi:hypothetical protein
MGGDGSCRNRPTPDDYATLTRTVPAVPVFSTPQVLSNRGRLSAPLATGGVPITF